MTRRDYMTCGGRCSRCGFPVVSMQARHAELRFRHRLTGSVEDGNRLHGFECELERLEMTEPELTKVHGAIVCRQCAAKILTASLA